MRYVFVRGIYTHKEASPRRVEPACGSAHALMVDNIG